MRRSDDQMSWNDVPGDLRGPTITESLTAAERKLREARDANRAGDLWAIKERANELEDIARAIRVRSIAIAFSRPMQRLPVHLEEEAE